MEKEGGGRGIHVVIHTVTHEHMGLPKNQGREKEKLLTQGLHARHQQAFRLRHKPLVWDYNRRVVGEHTFVERRIDVRPPRTGLYRGDFVAWVVGHTFQVREVDGYTGFDSACPRPTHMASADNHHPPGQHWHTSRQGTSLYSPPDGEKATGRLDQSFDRLRDLGRVPGLDERPRPKTRSE